MTTQSDVASHIINLLALTEPDLDTSVGSVTRKIIDAFAEANANSYTDHHLLTYQFDIDSKIEADLDDFVQQFGMSRIAARRATGVVTFYRGAGDTTRTVAIPVNTQIVSLGTPSITVQTVTPGFMQPGVQSVQVPVQAVVAGPSGNLGAGMLTRQRTPVEGVLATTNVEPLTGGVPAETDNELRARWKRTVFRSLAGTESMYLGIALNHPDCYAANVVGATKTHREQVQIVSGYGTSSIDDAGFIYADTAVLGTSLDSGRLLLRDYDFHLDTSYNPPRVIMPGTTYATGDVDEEGNAVTAAVEGAVFELSYEYAPRDSRNKPSSGITNRVDIWCAGSTPETAKQAVVFQSSKRFSVVPSSPYFHERFVRPDATHPSPDNVFVPLAFGPIISVPATLTMNSVTYTLGFDYFLVHDDSAFGYAYGGAYGLEWNAASIPSTPDPVFLVGLNDDYVFNAMVRDIQSGIDRWRLAGIDAVAHAAKLQALRFNLVVMYDRNASPLIVNTQVEQAIAAHLTTLSFDATVQVSDILAVAHNVPGVDNVRFLTGSDWATFDPMSPNEYGVGIQRVVAGEVVQSYVDTDGFARDIIFGDSELPVFESLRGDAIDSEGKQFAGQPAVRAQNSFYTPGLSGGA